MTEFNLSEKMELVAITKSTEDNNYFILHDEDVKEFIKRLKERVIVYMDTSPDRASLLKDINHLAGDKLK